MSDEKSISKSELKNISYNMYMLLFMLNDLFFDIFSYNQSDNEKYKQQKRNANDAFGLLFQIINDMKDIGATSF